MKLNFCLCSQNVAFENQDPHNFCKLFCCLIKQFNDSVVRFQYENDES